MRCLQYLAKFTDFPCPNHAPSREFFQDQDAIRAIAAGISRAGKPEVIRATTTEAGSSASNTSLSACPAATAKKRRSAIPRKKA